MRSGWVLNAAIAVSLCSPALSQPEPTDRRALCSDYQAQVVDLSAQLGRTILWDDGKIAKARNSLGKLQTSRTLLTRLIRRLNSAEQSAASAEAFDRSGEANFWRHDAADVRFQIDSEKKKAKGWEADAGVNCPGCTYSVAISKAQAAIDAAVAARTSAFQAGQQIADYKAKMAASGCGG